MNTNTETVEQPNTRHSLDAVVMPNKLTLKWGTLKGWDVKTPEAVALLKAYHDEPVSYSVMMQRDTPKQKETLINLIDLCDEIWLDWEGKQVSRDEAKEYLRTYGHNNEAQ